MLARCERAKKHALERLFGRLRGLQAARKAAERCSLGLSSAFAGGQSRGPNAQSLVPN